MVTQQIVINPLGLVTQPNKLGAIPEGSFSAADRVYMRDPGTVELANQWQIGQPSAFANADMAWCMLPDPTTALYVRRATGTGLWFYQWYDVVGNAFSFGPIQLEDEASTDYYIDDTGRWSSSTFRERTLLMCRRGTLIFDYDVPTSSAEADPRVAGLFPPFLRDPVTNTATTSGALKADTVCHAVAIIRRKFADGYEIVSPPSSAAYVPSTAAPDFTNPLFTVRVHKLFSHVGDIVEIYRTRAQPWLTTGSTNTGQDYYLSKTHVITAADLGAGNGSFNVLDSVPDEGLGVALYTNAGVSGSDAAANPPPTAKCVAEYRGYTFYGNRIEPPFVQFRVPVFWGALPTFATASSTRANGIGSRVMVGNVTNGLATLTAVSANDLVGIAVGQVSPGAFGGSVITTIVGSTVTFALPFTGATAAGVSITVDDVMEINSILYDVRTLSNFVNVLSAQMASGVYDVPYVACLGRVFPNATASGPGGGQATTVPSEWVTLSRLRVSEDTSTLTIRATNGANYVPEFPEITATAKVFTETPVKNGLSWSEEGQPENCPATNIQPIGRGEIIGLHSTRDCLWITCTDGLYRLSGTGGKVGQGYDWRADPVDKTLVLAQPQAWCVIRDQFHLYANRGWCVVDSDGTVNELSNGRIDDLMPGQGWIPVSATPASTIWMVADNTHDEVYLRVVPASGADVGRVYIYNLKTDAITADTTDIPTITAGPIVCNMVFSSAIRGLFGVIAYQSLTRVTQCYAAVETSNRATANLTYQPLYVDNPFTVKQWQTFSLALETAGAPSNLSVLAFANATSMNVRSPSGTSTPDFSRVGFGIPRNAPAVANMIAPALQVAVNNPSPNRVKLQGFALEFSEYTEQRKKR